MKFSIVIAIYNRSEELKELLESIYNQTFKNYEVLVIDDGSQENLSNVIQTFQTKLPELYYHKKDNSGPGLSRNYGSKMAVGDYLIFVDSDCILPDNYLQEIDDELNKNKVDAFGGPDMAHAGFNHLQKAISYSMTSLLTTGGVRGKKKAVTKFQPRSFNMGVNREIFNKIGGFSEMRVGEDPDLSMTLWEHDYKTSFFEKAGVFHKRRSTLKSFAKQVYQFGIARPILNQRHPKYQKITFWFPSLFFIGFFIAVLLFIIHLFIQNDIKYLFQIPLGCYGIYFILIFIHSLLLNKNIKVAGLSIVTSAIQLFSYGFGFLKSWIYLNLLKINPKKAFQSHFYQN